jgi:predicted dehydrogenase/threonine dehydrogenase-like Zn-dependent dehydrogenase
MKQIVQQQRTGRLSIAEVPAPSLRPEGLLVRTAYSLISAGTERAKVTVARKNLLGKALARPDQVRQVLQSARQLGLQATYQKVTSRLDALSPLGYSSAGVVLAVGARAAGFAPGDRVACAGGGYAVHAEIVYVPRNLAAHVPDEVGLDEAAFATLGAIALQGVRQAGPQLGETVGVIGLGLLGLLTVQLLRSAGCRVVGVDLSAARCALARQLGADAAVAPSDPALDALVRRYGPAGLDAVILTAATPSDEPIRLAGRLARDRARVVVVGDVGLDVPRSPFYEKELDVRLSRSYGPGRYDTHYEEQGLDYPVGYVRWTEGRNLSAVLDLLAQHKLDVRALTTHRFALDDAERAYALIEGKTREPHLGVLLEYAVGAPFAGAQRVPAAEVISVTPPRVASGVRVGLALVGAGNFAQSMLLPALREHAHVRLRTVVTPGGLTARSVAERAGFEQAAADPAVALDDPEVNLVLIASRHDSHAELAARALAAGKAVFVEKPLALTRDELAAVRAAYVAAPNPFLMAGFNRRFAPLVVALRAFVAAAGEPLLMHYRVNAGFIPREHWTQDPVIGGGRVLGELCHFADLLLFLAGQPPVEVYARALPDQGRYSRDNVAVLVHFADGSAGTITYAANGDRGLDKERLEVFGGGRAAALDDFRELTLSAGGRRRVRRAGPDKGHRAEMLALVDALVAGQPAPIPFAQLVQATELTLAVVESLDSGGPVALG